jgi:hypothetical protein
VIGYTTDNENKMHAAFRDDERNACVAHIQSKVMEKSVDAIKPISKLMEKSSNNALQSAQKLRKLADRKILQEHLYQP